MRQEVQKMVESTAKSQYEARLRECQEALAAVEADTTKHKSYRAKKAQMLRTEIKQLQKWVDNS
jgi:galactokinase